MKVRDVGIKEVYCANPSISLGEISSMMRLHNVGVMPVSVGRQLLGILTDRDIVISCIGVGMNPKECTARDFMTSNPITVTSDTDIEEAVRIMGREQIRRLPVVDAGNLVGIISLGDISVALSRNDSLVAETLRKISKPTYAGAYWKETQPTKAQEERMRR